MPARETMVCSNQACGRTVGVRYLRGARPGRGRGGAVPRLRVPVPHNLPADPAEPQGDVSERPCPNGRRSGTA
jgi:hypothetical protein